MKLDKSTQTQLTSRIELIEHIEGVIHDVVNEWSDQALSKDRPLASQEWIGAFRKMRDAAVFKLIVAKVELEKSVNKILSEQKKKSRKK